VNMGIYRTIQVQFAIEPRSGLSDSAQNLAADATRATDRKASLPGGANGVVN
jgi:hypothetical protein